MLLFPSTNFGANIRILVDLSNGSKTEINSPIAASVTSIGNQWYRISVTATAVVTGTAGLQIRLTSQADGSLAAYTGDGTSGIYIWGAQLVQGTNPEEYTVTTSAPAPIQVMGPLGFLGAEKLVENTAAVVPHGMALDTSSLNSATQYTLSVYAKAGERTWIRLGLVGNLGTDGGRAWYDLTNGVLGTVETNGAGSNINATINSIGGGWYRCRFTAQMNNGKTTLQSQVRLATHNNVLSYTGDGTSGIYIFGAQLSDSASLDPYSYNFGAAPTSTAYYGPRFDYDPVTLAPKGLLIEEQRVNSIRNNTMQGAVVGAPGTLPTNYTYTGGGLVANVVGIGYEGGINYVDIQFVGTATSGSSGLRFEGNTGVTASTGQTWNTSFYVRKISGTTSGISSLGSNLTYLIAGAGSDAITKAIPFDTLDLTSIAYNRQDVTLTAVTSGITTVRPQLIFGHTIGANVDITLRIGMPQLEQGAFPTSVIPTTTTQVTRTADNASMVGTNFSSWYNQSEGTIAANVITTLTTGYIASIMRASGYGPRLQLSLAGLANTTGAYVVDDTATVVVSLSRTGLNSAFAYKSDDYALSANASVVTDTAGVVPTGIIQAKLGQSPVGDNYLNGHIKSFKYFNKRLLNTYLQRLTR